MTTTTITYVLTRPNTTVEFLDLSSTNTSMQNFKAVYDALAVVDTLTYSQNQLVKTRVQSYNTSLQPQLDALYTQYASTIATELARRAAAGITTSMSAPVIA